MARVKRGTTTHARHAKVIKAAKGYYGRRKNTFRTATQAVDKARQYAYRDRRTRKREFRALWIQRINAAARMHGMTYSQMMGGLIKAGIEVDRKMLADLAVNEPAAFGALVERSRAQPPGKVLPTHNIFKAVALNVAGGTPPQARGSSLYLLEQQEPTMQDLDALKSEIIARIDGADTLDALDALRVSELGKKGRVSLMMRELGGMDPDARKAAGQALNLVKDSIAAAIEARQAELSRAALDARLAAEAVDVSLPSRPETEARLHPLSRTIEEVVAIFAEMGFTVAEGPDIESDFYNFTALNIPEEHPARQEHDTFYLPPDEEGRRKVLRTHTSPVQIRTMEATEPPIRIIVPGRTYRSDHDATHSPMFHQCEGLVIGDGIHMGHLKGCLIDFCRAFFGVDDLPVRFRPSYFPLPSRRPRLISAVPVMVAG